MLKNFHGFNIDYEKKCPLDEQLSNMPMNQTSVICKDISLSVKDYESNKTIEFVSNRNKVQGFFIINDILLFFDMKYIRVFLPET